MATNNTSPNTPASDSTSSLIQHIFTLAQQAGEQLLQLALTVDAMVSLDSAIEPTDGDDAAQTFAPPAQMAVLRRALKTEMRQQLKALALTTDALYVCAEAAAGRQ